jgi:hypothetical protein
VTAVSLLLYCLAAYLIIDRNQVMPVSRERLVEIKKFLDSQTEFNRHKDIFIFGSSTTIEGLDCNIIDEFLPKGSTSYNLAWTGGSPHQLLLILPSVTAARPAMVILCVDYWSLFENPRIPSEWLNIAGWWQFFPKSELGYFKTTLNEEEFNELTTPRLLHLWQMRSFLSEAIEANMREFSRPDLRYEGYSTNFKAPWVRTKVVSQAAMEKDIDKFRQLTASFEIGNLKRATDEIDVIVNYLNKNNIKVAIVLAPLNPKVADSIEKNIRDISIETLRESAKQHSAVFIDQLELLSPKQFADGAHAFESGRIVWSQALGQIISKEF